MLRRSLAVCLPSPLTLRRWCRTWTAKPADGGPGWAGDTAGFKGQPSRLPPDPRTLKVFFQKPVCVCVWGDFLEIGGKGPGVRGHATEQPRRCPVALGSGRGRGSKLKSQRPGNQWVNLSSSLSQTLTPSWHPRMPHTHPHRSASARPRARGPVLPWLGVVGHSRRSAPQAISSTAPLPTPDPTPRNRTTARFAGPVRDPHHQPQEPKP